MAPLLPNRVQIRPMGSRTVQKTIQVLNFILERGAYGHIREVSSALGIPRSTVHRICQALTEENILQFDTGTRQYQSGPMLMHIAQLVYHKTEVRRLSLPILRKIVERCNETAILMLYETERGQILFADQVQCNQPIRYHVPLGIMLPIHAGASGKAIMAFLLEEEIERILASGLHPLTSKTVTDPELLKKDLAQIRRQGYALSHGERTPEAVGIASPVFEESGRVTGGLIVTIPAYRFQPEMEAPISAAVMEASEQLSRLLGLPPFIKYPPSQDSTPAGQKKHYKIQPKEE